MVQHSEFLIKKSYLVTIEIVSWVLNYKFIIELNYSSLVRFGANNEKKSELNSFDLVESSN